MPVSESALSVKLSEGEGKLARALETNAALEKEITLLRQKIDLLVRRIFGSKSEQLDAAQLLFLLQGMDEPGKAPEPVVEEATRRSKGQSPPLERGPRLPEHLPVIFRSHRAAGSKSRAPRLAPHRRRSQRAARL